MDLLDNNGDFYRMAWDLAFMFSMLEMSSYKSHYVKDMLYAYNLVNPLNDHKVDNTYQVKLEKEIRSKEKWLFAMKFTKEFNLSNTFAEGVWMENNTEMEYEKYLSILEPLVNQLLSN